jgi:transposase-like protein
VLVQEARQGAVKRPRLSLRRWVAQADVDAGERPGVTTSESAQIKRLKAENRRLQEDNEILKAASVFSPGSSTPATVDRRVHR